MDTKIEFVIILFLYYGITKYLLISAPGYIKLHPKASYYLSIIHQGYVLPFFMCRQILGYGNNYKLMFISTLCYFLLDFLINKEIWCKDIKFVIHHLVTITLIGLVINVDEEKLFYPAISLFLLEIGSLWLSVTDVFPSKLNYNIRYYSYLVTRIIDIPIIYEAVINSGDLKLDWGGLSILLYLHNIFICRRMYISLR